MTLDVFAICYNESVLLPYFVKHYQDMGANITIYDNHSTDGSQDIIRAAGCNLIPYDSNGQIRDDIYLEIKNNCWKTSKADWVIVCDIDEFIVLPSDVSKCTMVALTGYDIVGMPPSKIGTPNKMYNKLAMFRPSQIQEINYLAGCHYAKPVGNIIMSQYAGSLYHYKYISEEYLVARHRMYRARLSEINKKHEWGKEYLVEENIIREKYREVAKSAACLQ